MGNPRPAPPRGLNPHTLEARLGSSMSSPGAEPGTGRAGDPFLPSTGALAPGGCGWPDVGRAFIVKGASPSRAFWGLGRLGRALGFANSEKVPSGWRRLAAGGPRRPTRGAAYCASSPSSPPRCGGGKGVDPSPAQPGKSELQG